MLPLRGQDYGLEPPWQPAQEAQVTRGVQELPMHCSITSPLHCHALSEQEEDRSICRPLLNDNGRFHKIRRQHSSIRPGHFLYCTGNNTGDVPGNLPDPYYWWEAGAFFGALINYWAFTEILPTTKSPSKRWNIKAGQKAISCPQIRHIRRVMMINHSGPCPL